MNRGIHKYFSLKKSKQQNNKPAIAAYMARTVFFDIGHCMVMHCDAGGVARWLTKEKQRKTDIRLTDQ